MQSKVTHSRIRLHTTLYYAAQVMEFMETDLYKIIYSKNELSQEHIQV
jgi:hypothetical protein